MEPPQPPPSLLKLAVQAVFVLGVIVAVWLLCKRLREVTASALKRKSRRDKDEELTAKRSELEASYQSLIQEEKARLEKVRKEKVEVRLAEIQQRRERHAAKEKAREVGVQRARERQQLALSAAPPRSATKGQSNSSAPPPALDSRHGTHGAPARPPTGDDQHCVNGGRGCGGAATGADDHKAELKKLRAQLTELAEMYLRAHRDQQQPATSDDAATTTTAASVSTRLHLPDGSKTVHTAPLTAPLRSLAAVALCHCLTSPDPAVSARTFNALARSLGPQVGEPAGCWRARTSAFPDRLPAFPLAMSTAFPPRSLANWDCTLAGAGLTGPTNVHVMLQPTP
mmetsp:Transcript_9032/g.22696  ORF Transcript_9032/g.22696 Transcript_9032/m.22696 type:complete len:341 (+) Transcript_9032:139-1161(+)